VKSFDDFFFEGPPITDQDGVFQEPAQRWVFTRGSERIEHVDIDANSLIEAYGERA
jgi:hypothetical protein